VSKVTKIVERSDTLTLGTFSLLQLNLIYLTDVPDFIFLSKVAMEHTLSSTAASSIPLESIPMILAGFKFAAIRTCLPVRSSAL